MNHLNVNTVAFCLVSLLISQTTLAQQWQLGHQPSQYSVPQYKPGYQFGDGETYPLVQDSPETQEPRLYAPADSMPTLESAPHNHPEPKLSYPLKRNSPPSPQHEQLPTTNPIPQNDVIHRDSLIGAPANNPLWVTPPQPTPLVPLQPPPGSVQSENQSSSKPGRFDLDYSIYRDRNTYPIDPRKPCNDCTRPPIAEVCQCQWPGKNGRPHQDLEPGTCRCSSASNKNRPNFSYNWPAPFSAIREDHQTCNSNCQPRKRVNDRFDHLADFKLINYKRTDSGYCGPGSDPYGCLGESRVAGIEFRQPGDAVMR